MDAAADGTPNAPKSKPTPVPQQVFRAEAVSPDLFRAMFVYEFPPAAVEALGASILAGAPPMAVVAEFLKHVRFLGFTAEIKSAAAAAAGPQIVPARMMPPVPPLNRLPRNG